jgi:uncharacterized metal-binding protein
MGAKCECASASKLIFACSGAADVGELADASARKLNREKAGSMFCLAGIGGKVSGIVKTTEAAADIVAIDGCSLSCARKTLEEANIKKFKHVLLTDMGFEKGKTTVNEMNIARVCQEVKTLL